MNRSYLPKDFIETAEGLCFAVVAAGIEQTEGQEKVLCFLRYIKLAGNMQWRKVGTETANSYLNSHFPGYLHHSTKLDANLHAVPADSILIHHQPQKRLRQIFQQSGMETRKALSPFVVRKAYHERTQPYTVRPEPVEGHSKDKVEEDVSAICSLFAQSGLDLNQVGITGSILIGAQNPASDIDLVIYDREAFHQARRIIETLIQNGSLSNLNDTDWHESYARRNCELTLAEYVWHERRKFNKGMVNGRKFDLNYVDKAGKQDATETYLKQGHVVLQARITQDKLSFDYPALYQIDHPDIPSVVCFIATYTGQAVVGEAVEISGLVEQDETGAKRIVVGSSREAPGEYIKVVHI